MIPDALDFILRPVDDEQAEYAAAAHKTSASLAPSLQGEADADSPDADAVGAPASGVPTWAPVDSDTGDLLANEHPAIPSELDEWEHFEKVLAKVAGANGGLIDQNQTRPLLRGEIAPRRVGAFFHRATKAGLIRAEGWTTSDDREGKNSGRPCRSYRYLGT